MPNTTYIKQMLAALKTKLVLWEQAYYQGEPLVSDEEYDASLQELIALEAKYPQFTDENSPTARVGHEIVKNFLKSQHQIPMLSLDNAFNAHGLLRYFEMCQKSLPHENLEFIIEPKIDGSSISLIYENGALIKAVSRGDGKIGEDITFNVKTIKNIPLILSNDFPANLEVRGEIYMLKSDFLQYNSELEKQGMKKLANPRNGVAGALRLQDSKEVAKKPLKSCLYQIVLAYEKHGIQTQSATHKKLKNWGFVTPPQNYIKLSANIHELQTFITNFGEQKDHLNIPCDGLVIKVNNLAIHNEIGYTTKFPKWAIAYKFPANIKKTQLLDIKAMVGRTGRITYVAVLEPVEIDQTLIASATLHNAEYIIAKDIRIGDLVSVYKAGEIIPKIIAPDLTARTLNLKPWIKPNNCPSCQSILFNDSVKVDQFCLNDDCIEKLYLKINHWCSRHAMNVEGLSKKIIIKLHSLNLIHDVADLYNLRNHKETILKANIKIKDKLFEKLVAAIEKTKINPLTNFLFGLGIEHVGIKVANVLAKNFLSLDTFMQLDLLTLTNLEEIGPVIAQSIVSWNQQPKNIALIQKLKAYNLNTKHQIKETAIIPSFLNQKNVVITGNLFLPRHELATILETKYQTKIQTAVNKKTDYLIVGENPGTKLTKAQSLGVKIINEQTIKELIQSEKN